MDNISVLSDDFLDKVSEVPRRRRQAFKERCKWLATNAHKSPRWLAENLNIILDHHLNKEHIQKLSHQELLVFGGSTTRAVSGSAFGVVVSSVLTAGCPLFAVSIGVNTWQLCISSTNLDRVREETKRRRGLDDDSFRKFEGEYTKKKRHHPAVDVVAGCTLKAAFMTATLGIIGFSDIADSFVAKFGEKAAEIGTEYAATATQTLPVYNHIPLRLQLPEPIDFSDFTSMFQDDKACSIPYSTSNLSDGPPMANTMTSKIVDISVNTLAADNPSNCSATVQTTTVNEVDLTVVNYSDNKSSIATKVPEQLSRAEQLEVDHPTTMKLDHARNDVLAPGSLLGQKLSQNAVNDDVKLGMEAKWADLEDLRDKLNVPTAKILGLVVTIGLVNEVFQPIPHMANIATEKTIDAWNGGQLSLASEWLAHIFSRSGTPSSS
ncbi:hypothetical protein K456DRAFT_1927766 [Colletotrichum gloeosporioides 23]|nr:hypothetical protein K456DRAFT_1927766 [Colletotrichum gloeosporioides 23]